MHRKVIDEVQDALNREQNADRPAVVRNALPGLQAHLWWRRGIPVIAPPEVRGSPRHPLPRAIAIALALAPACTTPAPGGQAGPSDLDAYRAGQVVIGFSDPLSNPQGARDMAAKGVASFSMELMPRITRAQSMDALSSMATIAGYKAVLEAATISPRLFPMLTTAAGTISPSKVFVIGAGVMVVPGTLNDIGTSLQVTPATAGQLITAGGVVMALGAPLCAALVAGWVLVNAGLTPLTRFDPSFVILATVA